MVKSPLGKNGREKQIFRLVAILPVETVVSELSECTGNHHLYRATEQNGTVVSR